MKRRPHRFEPSEHMPGGCAVCGDHPLHDPIHAVRSFLVAQAWSVKRPGMTVAVAMSVEYLMPMPLDGPEVDRELAAAYIVRDAALARRAIQGRDPGIADADVHCWVEERTLEDEQAVPMDAVMPWGAKRPFQGDGAAARSPEWRCEECQADWKPGLQQCARCGNRTRERVPDA